MDLQLNGIEEVDAAGNPLHNLLKVSELDVGPFFNHTRPTIDEFLLCIQDAIASYRSKYIAGGSFVQPSLEFRAIAETKPVVDDSNASNDVSVTLA